MGISPRTGRLSIRFDRLSLIFLLLLFSCILFDLAIRSQTMTTSVFFADGTPASCIGLVRHSVLVHPFQYAEPVPAIHIPGTDSHGIWKSIRSDHAGIYTITVYDTYASQMPRWSYTFVYWPGILPVDTLTLPFLRSESAFVTC